MKIESSVLAPHLKAAAVDQLASDLEAQGYKVQRKDPSGETRFDLVARRNGENGFYVVRVAGQRADPQETPLSLLSKDARLRTGRFHLIIVRPERGTDVSVAGLEGALRRALSGDPTGEFGRLGGASVERVEGVEIERIAVRQGGEIDVTGTAVASVSWMSGPPGADSTGDQIPFGFRAAVGPSGSVLDDPPPEFNLDLSDWMASNSREEEGA